MPDYEILAADYCRYGVLRVSKDAELLDVIEKPEFLICSDGYQRVRAGGRIIEEMTTPVRLIEGVS